MAGPKLQLQHQPVYVELIDRQFDFGSVFHHNTIVGILALEGVDDPLFRRLDNAFLWKNVSRGGMVFDGIR